MQSKVLIYKTSEFEVVRGHRTGAAALELLGRDVPVGLTFSLFLACGSSNHFIDNITFMSLYLQMLRSEPDRDVMLAGCEYWSALCEASVGEDRTVQALFKSKFPVYVTCFT